MNVACAATGEDGLQVRVGDRCAPCRRSVDRPMPSVLSLFRVVRADEELQEVDRLGRRVLADRDAVAAADAVGRGAGAAGHGREREPAELVAEALLVGAVGPSGPPAPTGPSAPWRPCRCRPRRPRCCRSRSRSPAWYGSSALSARTCVTGLRAGVGVPVAGLDHLAEGVAAADRGATRYVHRCMRRPLVLAGDRERGDAGGLELRRRRQGSRPRWPAGR